jgi:hypothetical protein
MRTRRWPGPAARWLLAASCLVLVTAACGVRPAATGSARPSASTALISGVVAARPGCPVEGRHDRFCRPRPLSDVRIEARALPAGVTAGTRTRADGHYSLSLGRGRYLLVAVTDQVLPRCPHVVVSVAPPASVRVNINCDSGIR